MLLGQRVQPGQQVVQVVGDVHRVCRLGLRRDVLVPVGLQCGRGRRRVVADRTGGAVPAALALGAQRGRRPGGQVEGDEAGVLPGVLLLSSASVQIRRSGAPEAFRARASP